MDEKLSQLDPAATLDGSELVYVVQGGQSRQTTAGALSGATYTGREKLTADRTYYVRTSGSDSNDGLTNTAAGAFKTIQKAIDTAYTLNLNGFKVIILVAAGSYVGAISVVGVLTGASKDKQPLQIIGDETTPGNVLISVTGGTSAVMTDRYGYLLIAGANISSTGGAMGFLARGHSTLEWRNIEFGNVASNMIIGQDHATLNAIGPTTVLGNAASFVHLTSHSRCDFTDQTINFNAASSNNFSVYLWGLNDATLELDGATLTGSQPVGKCLVHDHAMLNCYSLINAVGWGYLPKGSTIPKFEDGGMVTADGFQLRTFYVRSSAGGDLNDGLQNNDLRAFKTIQGCLDFIARFPFNPANFDPIDGVHIQVADGTYAETVKLRSVRWVSGTITGNTTTPANVTVAGVEDGFTAININTGWTVEGFKITAAAGSGLRAEQGSQLSFQKIAFGSCSNAQIQLTSGAFIKAVGNYSIVAGAPRHFLAVRGGIDISGVTVTLTGTPAFANFFTDLRSNSSLVATGITWVGSATGPKYNLSLCSTTDGYNASAPGNSAGTVDFSSRAT